MRIASLLALVVLLPTFAHGSVIFTEIMYDLSGTDTGREWVEITNTGDSLIDVSGYKFFEANTNHALTLISGNGVLNPGSSAIIADDPTKFSVDWPDYSGILFDSSFSLSNTGELLVLKDNTLDILDSVSYDSSRGAEGDGMTLQLDGSAFVSLQPSPGTYAGTQSEPNTEDTSTTTAVTTLGGSATYVPPPTTLAVTMSAVTSAVIEVPLHLSARATTKGGTIDTSAQISWSFGDGSSATGSLVDKTYRYAGTYVITVDAIDGSAIGHDEAIVLVQPARVRILSIAGDGITIMNDASERLDLSDWQLSAGGTSFRIPQGTMLLPKSSVLFPSAITRLWMMFDVMLLYPNSIIATRYIPPMLAQSVITVQPSVATTSYEKVQTVETITSKKNIQTLPFGSPDAGHEKAVNAPTTVLQTAAVGAAVSAVDSEVTPAPNSRVSGFFRSPWTLGLLGVIIVAGGAFILL